MQLRSNNLLIVAPYRDEEEFLETMVNELDANVELLNYSTSLAVSRGVWRRHLLIFSMAYRTFLKRNDKNFILFGEQFVGLYYAFFCRLFFWSHRSSHTMVLQLIYNRKAGLKGVCYRAIYRWLLQSSALNFLICHASHEREYYLAEFGQGIGAKMFFVPFGRNVPSVAKALEQNATPPYFFSGGTSNRDYKTLIDAFRGLSDRLVIACHPKDVQGVDLPANVTIRHDIFGAAFQTCIEQSYAVILPILETNVSGGQLVLLDAMRSGKATIVTSGSCMEDYVNSSCTISVPKNDADALKAAVNLLSSDAILCEQIGNSARLRYELHFTRRGFSQRLCEVMLKNLRKHRINSTRSGSK